TCFSRSVTKRCGAELMASTPGWIRWAAIRRRVHVWLSSPWRKANISIIRRRGKRDVARSRAHAPSRRAAAAPGRRTRADDPLAPCATRPEYYIQLQRLAWARTRRRVGVDPISRPQPGARPKAEFRFLQPR